MSRSQRSKGSEASEVSEDREQNNFEALLSCVKEITNTDSTFAIKKQLEQKPEKKHLKNAVKAAAEIVRVVCKTLHPKGSTRDIEKLANESLIELKSVIVSDSSGVLSETLHSIVSHYQNCDRKVIKRALLAEIEKHLKFLDVKKYVDESVTHYE